MRRVIKTSVTIIKDNLNSPVALFFVLLFPVILALVFAEGFGSLMSSATITVYVSGVNASYIAGYLNTTHLFIGLVGGSPGVVEKGDVFVNSTPSGITIYYPPYASRYVNLLQYSIESALTKPAVSVSAVKLPSPYSYQAYVLSGTIGAMVMSNGIFGVTGVAATYYRDKVIEKLASSPLRDYEWALSLIVYEVVISFASAIAVGVAGLLIGVSLVASLAVAGAIVIGTFLFAGLGAIIYGLTPKDRVFLANTAATVITFPLMFASNAFYPSSVFPMPFRLFVEYQPLSLYDDVLRGIVLGTGVNQEIAVAFTVAGLVILGVGIRMLRLRE